MDKAQLLKAIPLFVNFTNEELLQLSSFLKEKSFERNETICAHEASGDALYIILKGRVKVSIYNEAGKELILSVLKDGDFVGEMALLDGEPRSANVIALEKTSSLVLDRIDFVSYLKKCPDLAIKILKVLSQRLRQTDEQIANLALLDVYGRIARLLIHLAKSEGVKTETGVLIKTKLTHQEMAGMVGTSRETVSRAFSDFRKKNIITEDDNGIRITERALTEIMEKYSY